MPFVEDGGSTIKAWLYALGAFFTLAVIMVLIMPVIWSDVVPAIFSAGTIGLDANTANLISGRFDFLHFALRTSMYALFIGIVIYVILVIFNRERNDYMY